MDCIRAKEIAEKKMQNNDFEGARRIALKAQQLFPELENIKQLLTSCNVHCAAQNKIFGSEKDLYAILQLDKFADEVAIKKQIVKLALTLHPDNNKLPGAAAAFKLVGEARELLLDPGKKAVYDSKCKVLDRTAQPSPYQVTQNGSDEDDFESPSKRPSKNKSSGNNVVKEPAASKNDAEPSSTAINTRTNDKSEEHGYSEKSFSDETYQMEKLAKTTSTTSHVPGVVEILDDFESDLDPEDTAEPTVYYFPHAEFTDFDKEKKELCFAVDQIWALYIILDGMPRFYAQIKKIFKPGFKVLIRWLHGDPQNNHEISWFNEDLPFGCGRFELGDPKLTSNLLSFSHQVHFEKDKNSFSVFIRPRKGEIWALFKDWNRDWILDPLNHQKYKFEIVEVISDFSEDAGIIVSYLDKVRGFVCLFQRASFRESDFLLIRPDQMLRFSHSIPSCKMSGTEREGVPVGCFELHPAALPEDPIDICYPLKYGSLHRSQTTSKPSVPQETFLTACAHCRKALTAYDLKLSDKKVPYTSSMGKPQPKFVPIGKAAATTVKSEFGKEGKNADGGKVKSGNNNDFNLNSAAGGTHDGVHKKRESGVEENGRKRERKNLDLEGSSESCDTSR